MFRKLAILILSAASAGFAFASVEVITEPGTSPTCQLLKIHVPISLFMDPQLFLSDLGALMQIDPKLTIDEAFENKPLRRQLRVNEPVMALGKPFEFHNDFFKVLSEPSKLWLTEARKKGPLRLIAVKTCGEPGDPNRDELGFIREDELIAAMKPREEKGIKTMPPSIEPNNVPVYIPNN
jgi:hypothetical protein